MIVKQRQHVKKRIKIVSLLALSGPNPSDNKGDQNLALYIHIAWAETTTVSSNKFRQL